MDTFVRYFLILSLLKPYPRRMTASDMQTALGNQGIDPRVLMSPTYNYFQTLNCTMSSRSADYEIYSPKESTHQTLVPCMTPENFAVGEGTFAYQCTVGQAGDELLHKVVVYTMGRGKSREVMHCRNPQFPNGKTIACETEEVNAAGVLRLQRIERAL
ncbi:hypothetical protein [Geomonas edaphica]|uniref:hypothetical protein n=1 Tax=Geomonas edaphica TaxID=2570226 RepID=UPI0010A77490|nr:hypothetical protein [Geomonas edaphica]